uniref:Transmembrane 9 superfamily member n=1 Tax=Anisakis simplex TaxID=6269 RepID=A0A0M3JF08_ANISI
LVHGDVFRPPRHAMFLSVFVGSGSQIIFMVFVTLDIFMLSADFSVPEYLILQRNAEDFEMPWRAVESALLA